MQHAPWLGRPCLVPRVQQQQQPKHTESTHPPIATQSGMKESCRPVRVSDPSAWYIPARARVTGVAMHAAAARSASALGTARQWQHSFSVSIAIARTWKGGKGIGNGHCDAMSCACTVCEEKGDDCQLPPVALSKESFNRVVGPNNARHSSLEISPPHATDHNQKTRSRQS